MRSDAKTVPGYLRELPAERRAALTALRMRIKAAAPDATESMRHGMPTYEQGGVLLFGIAAQKNYLALYVCETDLVAEFRPRLGKVNCGKSCIRFTSLDALELDAISELLEQAAARRGG